MGDALRQTRSTNRGQGQSDRRGWYGNEPKNEVWTDRMDSTDSILGEISCEV